MTAFSLRLAGGGLLILAGLLFGMEKNADLHRRLRCLREMSAALGRMEGELATLLLPLPEIFGHLEEYRFFLLVSAGFGGEPLERLWRRAAETLPLTRAERQPLEELGGILGRYDAQRQTAEIRLTRERLEELARGLEREIEARGRRFAGLGAALGAMLAVLLF